MDLNAMIESETKITTLRHWEKTFPAECRPVIQARIAVVSKKPAYTYSLKLNPKGGVSLPVSVYLDGDGGTEAVESLIRALEEYKTHPDAKPYSKG